MLSFSNLPAFDFSVSVMHVAEVRVLSSSC